MTKVVLLGSQTERQTVGETVVELGLEGPIATITAGWQEWESDDGALDRQLGGRSVNLGLHAKAEHLWSEDGELRAAHRTLQSRLRRIRQLYNRRLAHHANDWMELLADPGPADLLDPERAQALDEIRALDAHHLGRIRDEWSRFEANANPSRRPGVARARDQIRARLDSCEAVVVEGGHVAVLHNRMRLFGLADLIADKTVIACAGGAMALSERVVLFHDSPPWGPGHTEVALPGLGLHRGLVVLPHAHARLRLDDPQRVSRLATRFAPARCVALEAGTRLDWDGRHWLPRGVEALHPDGGVRSWETAA